MPDTNAEALNQTVAIVSRKGGTGKTTLATNLAVCALQANCPASVIDLDPQGSAIAWSRLRANAGREGPVVSHAIAMTLDDALAEAQGLTLIDTPATDPEVMAVACEAADAVLIPCRPSLSDSISISHTLRMVDRMERRAWVVLSCVPTERRLSEAVEMLRTLKASHGIPVVLSEVCLRQYIDVARAADEGLGVVELSPSSKAAADMQSAYDWLAGVLAEGRRAA